MKTGDCCGTSYFKTHTQRNSSLRSKMWSSPFISLRLSSPNAVPPSWHLLSFTPSFCLLNTILSLWFCLNLSRMHLDISTPGHIGEIEGVRVLESETNRENDWERQRVTEVLREMTDEQRWRGKKGQTQNEVQKFFSHTRARTAKHAPTHTRTYTKWHLAVERWRCIFVCKHKAPSRISVNQHYLFSCLFTTQGNTRTTPRVISSTPESQKTLTVWWNKASRTRIAASWASFARNALSENNLKNSIFSLTFIRTYYPFFVFFVSPAHSVSRRRFYFHGNGYPTSNLKYQSNYNLLHSHYSNYRK